MCFFDTLLYKYKLRKIRAKLNEQIILESLWHDDNILIGWVYNDITYIVLDHKTNILQISKKYCKPDTKTVFLIINPFDYNIHSILNTMRCKPVHNNTNTIRVFVLTSDCKIDFASGNFEYYSDNVV